MRNLFYYLITFLLLQGCASFDKDLTNPYPLNESNLSELDGVYDIKQIDYDTAFKKFDRQMWTGNNFLPEIDRKLIKDTLHLDSLKNYKFGLKVLNKKRVRISYIENDTVFRERTLNAKLKKDGFLYLKNKNTGFLLVPYIAGAIDIKRTRLSKSENENLILDYSNHRSGAFLILAFLDGRTWKNRLEYKRIE